MQFQPMASSQYGKQKGLTNGWPVIELDRLLDRRIVLLSLVTFWPFNNHKAVRPACPLVCR